MITQIEEERKPRASERTTKCDEAGRGSERKSADLSLGPFPANNNVNILMGFAASSFVPRGAEKGAHQSSYRYFCERIVTLFPIVLCGGRELRTYLRVIQDDFPLDFLTSSPGWPRGQMRPLLRRTFRRQLFLLLP